MKSLLITTALLSATPAMADCAGTSAGDVSSYACDYEAGAQVGGYGAWGSSGPVYPPTFYYYQPPPPAPLNRGGAVHDELSGEGVYE